MEKQTREVETDTGDITADADVTFDPSDFIPRRTSRASAQAASEAIKKSILEEKTDPYKMTGPEATGRKAKVNTSTSTSQTSAGSSEKKRARKKSDDDCFVKLERCDDDSDTEEQPHQLGKRAGTGTVSNAEGFPSYKNMKGENYSLTICGEPISSKYEVVYAPVHQSEQVATAGHYNQIAPSDSGIVSGVRSGSKRRGEAPRPESPPIGKKKKKAKKVEKKPTGSVNVVMVHPKPGSIIIDAGPGRIQSRAAVLMGDPRVALPPSAMSHAQVPASEELECKRCSRTYANARGLTEHKRRKHGIRGPMCQYCGEDFPDPDDQQGHGCKRRYCCDVCGWTCGKPGSMANHKRMTHSKLVGSYMCYKCCYNAHTQDELELHLCGGKPLKTPVRGMSSKVSSTIMVYPNAARSKSKKKADRPHLYVDLTAPPSNGAAAAQESGGNKFLCEICLEMFPSSHALETHTCGKVQPLAVVDVSAAGDSGSLLQPLAMGFQGMPDVEQLAKFYSSVVFDKD